MVQKQSVFKSRQVVHINERGLAEVGYCRRNLRTFFSDNFFYVFVDLKPGNDKPDFYIVPSEVVAKYVRESHEKWLKEKSKSGKNTKIIQCDCMK